MGQVTTGHASLTSVRSRRALAGVAVTLALAACSPAPEPPSTTPSPVVSSSPSIPAPEPSPSASAAPADVERAECAIDFAVTESWPGGFKVEATVLNLGAPLDGWELSWRFEGDEQVEDLWNGVVVARSEGVVVV